MTARTTSPVLACAAVGIAAALSACGGPTRSVSSYCQTYAAEKKAYLEKYDAAGKRIADAKDPLTGLLEATVMSVQAMGDIETMFVRLDKVAPEEIQPDVQAVHDSIKKQVDALASAGGSPIGALVAGLVSGISSGGSWQRVGDWTQSHCGSA